MGQKNRSVYKNLGLETLVKFLIIGFNRKRSNQILEKI